MAIFAPGKVGGSIHLSVSGVAARCCYCASAGITPTRRTISTVRRFRRMVDPSMMWFGLCEGRLPEHYVRSMRLVNTDDDDR
jgi:hypothetical protein